MLSYYDKEDEGYQRARHDFNVIRNCRVSYHKRYEMILEKRSPYSRDSAEGIGYEQARRHTLDSMKMVYPIIN